MKVKYTKKGQPYIITSSGRAKFLKKSSSRKSSSKKSYKRGAYTMAKRKSYSRSSGKSYGMIGTIAGAAAYGAVRAKLSDALTPITNQIPLGNISDEVTLGVLAILAKRTFGKKAPMVAKVADAALVIESARIGEAAISGQLGGMTSSSSSNMNYLG